jgi:hypothetical protein
MNRLRCLVLAFMLAPCLSTARAPANAYQGAEKIRVLIIDGQNNHLWRVTTPLLRRLLEDSGRFVVEVSTTPANPGERTPDDDATPEQRAKWQDAVRRHALALDERRVAWAAWRPHVIGYAVVLSNYNGELWPEEVRSAFVAYLRGGGGFVVLHAASNAFASWPDYNEAIGLGGWGGRTPAAGPHLRRRNGRWAPIAGDGPSGAHGPRGEIVIDTDEARHPIMAGLPARWLHPYDELYSFLRGPAQGVSVLASAPSSLSGEAEPMLMALRYGQGRVFHTTLGHGPEALNGLWFQVTLLRGTEWAATGVVTLPAPTAIDFSPDTRAALRPIFP